MAARAQPPVASCRPNQQPTPSEKRNPGDAADHDADARDRYSEQEIHHEVREDEQKKTRNRLDGRSDAEHRPVPLRLRRTHLSQPEGRSLMVRLFSLPVKPNGVW